MKNQEADLLHGGKGVATAVHICREVSTEGMQGKIRFWGVGLKIKRSEIKSKTLKERIISFASVEYVIVFFFFLKKRKRKITTN